MAKSIAKLIVENVVDNTRGLYECTLQFDKWMHKEISNETIMALRALPLIRGHYAALSMVSIGMNA